MTAPHTGTSMRHSEAIVDQFTRQAAQFAQSPTARSEDILERMLRMARPQPMDEALDVACGPGVLVCALAKLVQGATGIDLTPAMLDQARRNQQEQGLSNVSWELGDATALAYQDQRFSIVTCRFAFHHFPEPLRVLREMRRVCRPGARIVVADSAPAAEKADAFNAMERMRDPSHTRAVSADEICALFAEAGLSEPKVDQVRLGLDLDSFLARSYPGEGDEQRIWELFERALGDDTLDLQPRRERGRILFSVPVAIVGAQVGHAL